MRFVKSLLAAGLIAGAAPLLSAAPASAAPIQGAMSLRHAAPSMTETVQYRRWHGGRHYYGRRGYGWGAPVAGFAAGALIGGAIASQNAPRADAVDYCVQRFRSYDPGSGTYLGNDGYRHPCP
jgi:hypothetical protein